MSTAAATPDAPPAKKSNKKLIIIIAAVVAVLALGGGAAVLMMKKSAAAAEEMADGDGEGHDGSSKRSKAAKAEPKAPPIFVPLDPFTVNLADRQAERFAQVGITLEVTDSKIDTQIKAFMPVIRNNILLALADNTSAELMTREGKAKLAERIQTETARALGIDVDEADGASSNSKGNRKSANQDLPITGVHFSNFIIQ